MRACALLHVAERRVECAEVALRPPGPGEVTVRSVCSAISPGTEGMIYAGAFPRDAPLDASIAELSGRFAYPFAYGYALVGVVEAIGPEVDPEWRGATVFVFHPHQDRIVVPAARCERVPPEIPTEAALFLPQVETWSKGRDGQRRLRRVSLFPGYLFLNQPGEIVHRSGSPWGPPIDPCARPG